MRGVNKVILLGVVARDPEVRVFGNNGGTLTNISIGTEEAWKDKDGALVKQTEWHRVVFYGRLAEVSGEYLRKGSKVYVEGSIHTRKWQDKTTGQDRYSTEIKASMMQLVDGRAGAGNNQPSSGGGYDNNDYGYNGGQQDDYQAAPRAPANKPAANRPAPVAHNDLDDDLPF